MTEFFPTLLLGHILGDYIFQNRWMALNKSSNSWICLVHCLVYTAAITVTTWSSIHSVWWSLFVFLTHFPLDRWALADLWLRLTGGNSISEFHKLGDQRTNNKNLHILDGAFSALVYAVVDNGIHLLLVYYGYILFF